VENKKAGAAFQKSQKQFQQAAMAKIVWISALIVQLCVKFFNEPPQI
jgi:hypothetical protein